MTKKNFAIILCITSNLTFAAANVLFGLKKHSPNLADEIIIFNDGISDKDKNIMNGILPCQFIEYKFPIHDTSKFNQVFFNQFTELSFARYEAFTLLNNYKTILYLDVDILVQNDISAIVDFTKTGFGILQGDFIKTMLLENYSKEDFSGFDLEKQGYSSGTFIINDTLKDYDKMSEWCYKATEKYAQQLYLPDQAVINLLCQAFNFQVTLKDG